MIYLDSNVIIRYLTRDDEEKAARCRELLQKADRGEVELTTSESVVAEVVYVLSSRNLYAIPPERVRDLLLPIIDLRGLKVASRRLYHRALEVYATQRIDFTDALVVAHMEREGVTQILSYDEHFDRVEGIERKEP